ncbi:MAG: HAD-IA family hydrolase [Clostridium sp.]|uniref:HAD family hydrolase n=1 Tax=Clostridium sp. TaxID=1506 RepID=UPI002911D38A|nr:HAD-IA family hydrolase [Clostridium sp.]MDU5111059.1 HAD-IA family hydrolase [Clostridium sp.]
MSKYKCMLFDLDGTVLNTERMNMIPLQRLIKEELGIEMSYNEVLKFKPYPGMKVMEELGFEDKNTSYAKWVKYVNDFEEGATLFEGFEEVFKELNKRNIICGVVSAKTRDQYEIDFIQKGLDKYVKCEVLADDTELHKPHPEPLLKAAEILNISPSDCLYVGDTIFDYKASKAAGMDFGLALWGADSTEGIYADYSLKESKDLLKIV